MIHAPKPSVTQTRMKYLFGYLVIFVLLATKSPDALLNPQFWAEDGVTFFAQQYEHPFTAFFMPYAGYFHAIPRIVALVSNIASYAQTPLLYNAAALLIDSAAIFYFSRRAVLFAPAWTTALIVLLVPIGSEILGSLTNIQWFLQFALFAAALFPSEAKIKGIFKNSARIIITFLMAITGPFSIFCAIIGFVLYLQNIFYRQNRHANYESLWKKIDKRLFFVVTTGAIIQTLILIFGPPRSNAGPFSIQIASQFFLQGMEQHLLGTIRPPLGITMSVIVFCLGSTVLLLARDSYLKASLYGAMLAFSCFTVLGVSSEKGLLVVSTTDMSGDRYYFFAKVIFWLGLAAAIRLVKNRHAPIFASLIPIGLACVAFRHPALIQRPPLTDMHWKQQSHQLERSGQTVDIPINPEPWRIRIPSAH
jgi:hypothetical protein